MSESLQHVTVLDPRAAWLDGRQRNDTSQFGEDGLIEALFERIGTTNEWCFEVGAADGLFFSNTKRLRDAGWRAVLIECDPVLYARCAEFETERVQVVQAKVDGQSLNEILNGAGAPQRPDLGVIDVDGQDYWLLKGLACRPRVLLVEFANYQAPDFIPPLGSEAPTDQAGLQAIVDLGASKGYAAIVKTYCNVLLLDRLGSAECNR